MSDAQTFSTDDQLISKKEAARLLSVSTKTIERLVELVPDFPRPIVLPYVERKHIRFSKREIIAFKDRSRHKPAKRLKPAKRQKPAGPDKPTDSQHEAQSRTA